MAEAEGRRTFVPRAAVTRTHTERGFAEPSRETDPHLFPTERPAPEGAPARPRPIGLRAKERAAVSAAIQQFGAAEPSATEPDDTARRDSGFVQE